MVLLFSVFTDMTGSVMHYKWPAAHTLPVMWDELIFTLTCGNILWLLASMDCTLVSMKSWSPAGDSEHYCTTKRSSHVQRFITSQIWSPFVVLSASSFGVWDSTDWFGRDGQLVNFLHFQQLFANIAPLLHRCHSLKIWNGRGGRQIM